MGARLRVIDVARTTHLGHYRLVGDLAPQVDALVASAAEVRRLSGARRVWMLNSTESGGGVAEMLPRLCSLLTELGLDARWLVLEPGDAAFFGATKALHNMLHGRAPSEPVETIAEAVRRTSAEAATSLRSFVDSEDVLIVHDPQPAAIPGFLAPEHRPALLWRCHVGVPFENEHTRAAWKLLEPALAPYTRLLFSSERYVPRVLEGRSGVLQPGIDPLSHKNRELHVHKLVGVLRAADLIDGPPPPRWTQFARGARRLTRDGWVEAPIPDFLFVPVVLQVSRFDRLKGFDVLMPAFERALRFGAERAAHLRVDSERGESELARTILILAGPEPAGIADDPEAARVLAELCQQWQALPDAVAARVHVVQLPMASVKENALVVNALQRSACVIAQCSLEEGFGLTVTEALWKGVPVVASNVGGLSIQVRRGTDGLLVDDPRDADAVADALIQQLLLRLRAEAMAASGKRRVAEHFLVITQMRRWLEEIGIVLHARAEGRGVAA